MVRTEWPERGSEGEGCTRGCPDPCCVNAFEERDEWRFEDDIFTAVRGPLLTESYTSPDKKTPRTLKRFKEGSGDLGQDCQNDVDCFARMHAHNQLR